MDVAARYSSFGSSVSSDFHQSGKISPSDKLVEATCWCTYCHRPFKTKDGWSRHENQDHEDHVYFCMPNGPVENRGRGPECSICGTLNPDENHLILHQSAQCLKKPVFAREYKRRCDLVSHLSSHGVLKVPNSLGLAEQWKRTSNRKAWACGFCVKGFSKRMDRINHIHKHWLDGANMNSWNPSMVIQGLLLQPLLSNKWSELLRRKSILDPLKIEWRSSVIEDLQRRLEVADEPPESLVTAAYERSSLGQGNERNLQTTKPSVALNPKSNAPWHSLVPAQNTNPNQNSYSFPTDAGPTFKASCPASISVLPSSSTHPPDQSGLEVGIHGSLTREQSTSCLFYPASGHQNASSFHGSTQMPDFRPLNADMQAPHRWRGTGSPGFPSNQPRQIDDRDMEHYPRSGTSEILNQTPRLPVTRPLQSSIGQVNPNSHQLAGDLPLTDFDIERIMFRDSYAGNLLEWEGLNEFGQLNWHNALL